MSDARHTPGPWGAMGATVWHGPAAEVAVVANCASAKATDVNHANAALIAAAPDMLEALEGLLPMWESGISEPWIDKARAAIAKATVTP